MVECGGGRGRPQLRRRLGTTSAPATAGSVSGSGGLHHLSPAILHRYKTKKKKSENVDSSQETEFRKNQEASPWTDHNRCRQPHSQQAWDPWGRRGSSCRDARTRAHGGESEQAACDSPSSSSPHVYSSSLSLVSEFERRGRASPVNFDGLGKENHHGACRGTRCGGVRRGLARRRAAIEVVRRWRRGSGGAGPTMDCDGHSHGWEEEGGGARRGWLVRQWTAAALGNQERARRRGFLARLRRREEGAAGLAVAGNRVERVRRRGFAWMRWEEGGCEEWRRGRRLVRRTHRALGAESSRFGGGIGGIGTAIENRLD